MAKTSYLTIPAGLENFYWSILQPQDRFVIARVKVKTVFLSPAKIAALTTKQLLTQISEIWKTFTPELKAAWKAVDFHPRKHGWRTFVADQSKRIKYGLSGTAIPSIYHQDLVGEILIGNSATEIKLIQPHPHAYWVSKKVAGTKNMYEPVEVIEEFALPLKIGISFKSNLTSAGENPSAKFYAKVLHLYQGQNLYENLEIEIPLVANWQRLENTLSLTVGQAISYNLYIELKDVQGKLLFDNVLAEHSAQNWARDIYCKKVEQSFTRGFYQVPKHWAVITLPEGAGYRSIYYGLIYPPLTDYAWLGQAYLGMMNLGKEP